MFSNKGILPPTRLELAVANALSLVTRERLWLAFISYIFFVTLYFSWRHSAALHAFTYGDWVIHYGFGFVRRGLIGQLLISIGGTQNAPTLVFLVKAALYFAFLYSVYRLYRPLLHENVLAFCLLAPTAFSFTVLDSDGAGRKELILLACMAVQCAILAARQGISTCGSRSGPWIHLCCLLASLSVAVLSHEGLFFFCGFPLLVLHLDLSLKEGTTAATRRTLFAATWLVILFLLQAYFSGNSQLGKRLCAALGASAPMNCSEFSAITWLGGTGHKVVNDVLKEIGRGALYVYGFSALLSALPIYLVAQGSVVTGSSPVRRSTLLAALIIANLSSIPLYLAVDWGRWQYITVCCNLLFLGYCYRIGIMKARPLLGSLTNFSNELVERVLLRVLKFGMFAYVFLWNVPHYGAYFDHGHIGLIERIAVNMSKFIYSKQPLR